MADLRIQVLGPARAWRGGEPTDIGPAGQRALFGLLALMCGQTLSRSEIIAGLWPDRTPPDSAANVIQTYVMRLRRVLEPDRPSRAAATVLCKVGDGYRLRLPGAAVDAARFREHVAAAVAAQQRGQLDAAAESLGEALRLWHGPPLADIPVLADHPKVVALAAERQEALARYGEVMIDVGRAADGLPALEEAAAGQPLNEAWQARLIRAYHAAGRRSQAFATYHGVRDRLAEELGLIPGPELSAAHGALLHAEDATDAAGAMPAQLPADSHTFTGRTAELARLDLLLDEPRAGTTVVAISGAPGVGKSTLAVRWAHRIAWRFPDGQLYLSLRGFDADGIAKQPSDAVLSALEALAVPAERMPTTPDARTALYRSLLAGRRMLIVLDNARDAAQVRPLLPGTAGCLVVVTSRDQLAGLVAAEGAHPVPIEPFTPDAARLLLTNRVGAARTSAEPAAVAEIIDRCAGLPLALVIIAARAALNEKLPLSVLAEQLRHTGDRLDALTTGEPGTDLRAVFSWSYHALTPQAARLFRLLGLHAGPDISAPATASLAAHGLPEAGRLLTELVQAGLATEPVAGRYLLHDLVRAYAAEVAAQDMSGRARRIATLRMLDHYLHSAYAAAQLDRPTLHDPFTPQPPRAGVTPEVVDAERAPAWFAAERAVLIAAVERAAAVSPRHAWQLAWSLATHLDRRGYWEDLAILQRAAIAAARSDGDPRAQAGAHRLLARAHTRLRRVDDARLELRRALQLYRQAGNQIGESRTYLDLSLMRERQGRYRDALNDAMQGLEIIAAVGHERGTARALNAVGWYHALLGDFPAALRHCRAALARLERLGDRAGMATTLDSIGYAHHHLGEHAPAVAAFRQAIDIYRDIGDDHLRALVLTHLGDSLDATGDGQAARSAWRRALDALQQYDPPEADKVRARLAAVDVTTRH